MNPRTTPPPTCFACRRLGHINRDLMAEVNRLTASLEDAQRDRDAYRAECARSGSGRRVPRGTLGPQPDGAHQHPPCTDGSARAPSNWHPSVSTPTDAPAPSVRNGQRRAHILDLLAATPQGLTVAQIRDALGIKSNYVHTLLYDLKHHGEVISLRQHSLGIGRQALYRLAPPHAEPSQPSEPAP